jgi:hypothetical protein
VGLDQALNEKQNNAVTTFGHETQFTNHSETYQKAALSVSRDKNEK